MRRAFALLAVVAVVGLAAIGAFRYFAACAPVPAPLARLGLSSAANCPAPVGPAAAETPRLVEPPTVTVATAAQREFVDRLFVSGTLVAREEALVAARVDGLAIVELDAEDGDAVAAGQVLARLDRSQLDAQLAQNDAATARADAAIAQAQSQIEQFEAQLGLASDDSDRAHKLGGQVMAAATIEQREVAVRTAGAQLAAAKNGLALARADRKSREAERQELLVRIARTEVKAPVAGLVSRRTARLGATVSSVGEPLFRIIKDGAVDLEAEVPEQSLARLSLGMPAKLRLPGAANEADGVVRLVSQEVDKASRTGKARIALAAGAPARIGSFASGEIEIARSQGVGVPASAVQREGDGARVLVVRDGVVETRRVTAGIAEGEGLEILSGVAAGERVVARAAAFLRGGDRVRAVTLAAAPGAAP
ncbi:MAG TPA: efflux RND transporter periplasmic adaptor subunit [Roseiarcus sp.]|nr:efflux RND transporter periplasmic adaptor subunit [Roseiarcus sp.]